MIAVQSEVTLEMRTVLVDWIAELRDEFRLQPETLFLAVAYLDRYLCARPVGRPRLQLLGLACLAVAAKLHEVYPPPLASLCAMADGMYDFEELVAMEKEVLFGLNFQLALPTSNRFLHYVLALAPPPPCLDAAASVRALAAALLELTLMDTAFLRQPPSAVAAAAAYLALGLVRHHEGLAGTALLSGTDPAVLSALVRQLSGLLAAETALAAAAAAEAGAVQVYGMGEEGRDAPQPRALLSRYTAWERMYGREQPTAVHTGGVAVRSVSQGRDQRRQAERRRSVGPVVAVTSRHVVVEAVNAVIAVNAVNAVNAAPLGVLLPVQQLVLGATADMDLVGMCGQGRQQAAVMHLAHVGVPMGLPAAAALCY